MSSRIIPVIAAVGAASALALAWISAPARAQRRSCRRRRPSAPRDGSKQNRERMSW